MKTRITRYGIREIRIALIAAVLAGLVCWWLLPSLRPWCQLAAGLFLMLIAAFFRDPHREIPDAARVLLAPADGKVTDIVEVEEQEFLHGPAVRIGIFLSVFDAHINRTPCAGKVGYVKEHPGRCLNALRFEAASAQNQANCVGLNCTDHPARMVMVKQITGAIARRIVCSCRVGDELTAGERFGMIKFGSRTELFMPIDERLKVVVEKGATVRAGETILVRYD